MKTTCPYCGVGCGIEAHVKDDGLVIVDGDKAHPANMGQLCIKGMKLPATTVDAGRLAEPEIHGKKVNWTSAINAVADGLAETIQSHGTDAVAFYLSGQLLTEDYYVANKLMKGFIGSANVDTNSRLCMASAVAAHKRAFGEDVVPCTYEDLDSCSLAVLVGSNAAWTHPIVFQRLEARKEVGDLTLIVIDPRRTATAEIADLHLAIKPGSDITLFNGLLRFLVEQGMHDQLFIDFHTNGFEQTLEAAIIATPEKVSNVTGLDKTQLLAFYKLFALHPKTVSLFSQGINQSRQGTDQANAIINCHLAAGKIGKPGAGPFSITGQPNAMGGREVGGMANQLAAHMDFNPANIARVGRFWRTNNMATRPGLKAVDMFDAMQDGRIKAVWIMGTNPVVSLPNREKVRDALASCPLVIVSDCVAETDTMAFADIKLPAMAWGEKNGTVTNSVRVISRQRGFAAPFGNARADWQIVSAVAAAMGYSEHFDYQHPAEIFAEHASLTNYNNHGERLLNLDFLADLDVERYDKLLPTAWPQEARVFEDACFSTKDGRACFVPVQQLVDREDTDGLIMNTGRYRDQWHTMTRTGLAADLFSQSRLPCVTLHPQTAEAQGFEQQDLVELKNELGSVRLLANISDEVAPGQAFVPIHWNDQFASSAGVNELIVDIADPISGQPQSKQTPVTCSKCDVAVWAQVVSRKKITVKRLHCSDFLFWSGSPIGEHWQYTVALQDVSELQALLPDADIVHYEAPGVRRILGRSNNKTLWLLFAGERLSSLPAPEHLCCQIDEQQTPDWAKLSAEPLSHDGPLVCTCFEVTAQQIERAVTDGNSTLEQLGKALGCGTNCGSCKSELRSVLRRVDEGINV